MKTLSLKIIGLGGLLSLLVSSAFAVSSTPVGYVTQTIDAAKFTTLSLPLYSPTSTGTVSAVSSPVITSSGSSFGTLSDAATPNAVKVTSGSLAGTYFPIASNTADTITVSGDVSSLVVDDTFEVVAVDTLSSLFGSPADGTIVGGAKSVADIVFILQSTGTWNKYFHNNSNWVQDRRGNPNSDNVQISPDSGILVNRVSSTPTSFVLTGTVPSTQSIVNINQSGFSVWPQAFPTDITLQESGIQNTAELSSSDRIFILQSSGAWNKYFHDGTNWRQDRRGSPISDSTNIASGSAVLINKASPSSASASVTTPMPYTLSN
jgi:uncharacterized protein (TIGR02597 family)